MVARVAREFGGIRVDTGDWPVILMDLPAERIADADLRAALTYLEQLMRECERNREKCAQVTDASRIQTIPNASLRNIAGEWATSTLPLQKAVSAGGAIITPSSIIRGIITAVVWLYKPESPIAFFATRDEAMLQALLWLDEGRATLTPRLRTLRDKLTQQAKAQREKQPSGVSWRR